MSTVFRLRSAHSPSLLLATPRIFQNNINILKKHKPTSQFPLQPFSSSSSTSAYILKSANMPSLYEITIPVFIKEMKILQTLLTKGAEHVGEGKDKLVDVKLIDDMQGLGYQSTCQSYSSSRFQSWLLSIMSHRGPTIEKNTED
jgi:hypothetical protein